MIALAARRARGAPNQLGLGLQYCTLPWLGFVLDDPATASPTAVHCLSDQLGVDAGVLVDYGDGMTAPAAAICGPDLGRRGGEQLRVEGDGPVKVGGVQRELQTGPPSERHWAADSSSPPATFCNRPLWRLQNRSPRRRLGVTWVAERSGEGSVLAVDGPVAPSEALPGRAEPMEVPERHFVLGTPLRPPSRSGTELAMFSMGCFWGAERFFWETPGVVSTAVGYAGGTTPNPHYEEVVAERTGHNEVVFVAFDPARLGYETVLSVFWEHHDPTQWMRQGDDVGARYRSTIYVYSPAQRRTAERSRIAYQEALSGAGYGTITTVVVDAPRLYYAEAYHQQYLAKTPEGTCGLVGTGVEWTFPKSSSSERSEAAGPGGTPAQTASQLPHSPRRPTGKALHLCSPGRDGGATGYGPG